MPHLCIPNQRIHKCGFCAKSPLINSENSHSGRAECGAAQIFDLIRGTYVKTVAEQSTLLRCECDALQLTALVGASDSTRPYPFGTLESTFN
jgi:hypothetical protein